MRFLLSTLLAAICSASVLAQDVGPSTSTDTHVQTEEHRDELRRARAALEKDLQADPKNDSLWLHLAFIEHKMGDFDAAEGSFSKVVELNPQESAAHYMLALIYEKKGQKDKAAAAWKQCVAHSKDPNLLSIAQKHLQELKK
jgi:Tfp pilus assembly protein PilF